MQRAVLIVVTILLAIITALALKFDGLTTILVLNFQSFAEFQVFFDLVIALGLFIVWMWKDAKKTSRNALVWTITTLAIGSFGPLLYLLTSRSDRTEKLS
jgi:hypothetical protein